MTSPGIDAPPEHASRRSTKSSDEYPDAFCNIAFHIVGTPHAMVTCSSRIRFMNSTGAKGDSSDRLPPQVSALCITTTCPKQWNRGSAVAQRSSSPIRSAGRNAIGAALTLAMLN
ncbi:Uncharacterised protein [Mycobacteroides abscessus subsp. abscessus]|nr:Uncharacterised protein [Mycobacteroides abscessus subsp. abscessus]